MRSEVIVHNAKALGWKRGLPAFPAIIQRLQKMLYRFLDQLHGLDQCFVADDTMDTLGQSGQVGQARTTGIDLNKPRLRAVMEAVIALAVVPGGFTVSQLADKVRDILGLAADQY